MRTAKSPDSFIGRPVDQLSLDERWLLAGKWIALEIYTPETMPLRLIEALADSSADCVRKVAARGLEPSRFEYLALTPPY